MKKYCKCFIGSYIISGKLQKLSWLLQFEEIENGNTITEAT